jgi:menaquinone-dependent protoporphyrinogen oxidase
MRNILALYGTAYGQTEKIVRRIAARLAAPGQAVTMLRGDALPADLTLEEYDAFLIAASVIREHHQPYIVEFVRRHAGRLNHAPSAFVSVCGAAIGTSTGEQAEAHRYIERFLADTGWLPRATASFAGAITYTRYGLLLRWFMKRISRKRGRPTDTSRDHEFTDWAAVDRFAREVGEMVAPPVPVG